MKLVALLAFLCIFLSGCYHGASDSDDLRTVPVTNNPNFIPSRDTQTMSAMPY